MRQHVPFEGYTLSTLEITFTALKWLLASVRQHVPFEVVKCSKLVVTLATTIRFCVVPHVLSQLFFGLEGLGTLTACVDSHLSVASF